MKRRFVTGSLTLSPAPWLCGLRDRARTAVAKNAARGEQGLKAVFATDREEVKRLLKMVEGLRQKLVHTHKKLRRTQLDTVTALVAAVEAKDPSTEQHSTHGSHFAEQLARPFQLSQRQLDVIKTAALLHDVGKIGVPDAILTKPGPLTQDEFRVIQQHPVTGAAILRSAACLQREVPLVLHHHERYDGTGYPDGLKGEEIPFGARILHVADSVDAMLSLRSYKKTFPTARVISELRRGRGTQFDPIIAKVAVHWLQTRTAETDREQFDPQSWRVPAQGEEVTAAAARAVADSPVCTPEN